VHHFALGHCAIESAIAVAEDRVRTRLRSVWSVECWKATEQVESSCGLTGQLLSRDVVTVLSGHLVQKFETSWGTRHGRCSWPRVRSQDSVTTIRGFQTEVKLTY